MSEDKNDSFWTKLVTLTAQPAVGMEPVDKQPVHRAVHEAGLRKRFNPTGSGVAAEMLDTVFLRVENAKHPLETCRALHTSLLEMASKEKISGQDIVDWYQQQIQKLPYRARPDGEALEHYVDGMKQCRNAGAVVKIVAEHIPMIEPLAAAYEAKIAGQLQSEGSKGWLGRVGASIGLNKPQR